MPKIFITTRRTKAHCIEIPANGGWMADDVAPGIHALITNTRDKPVYVRHTP